MKTIDIKGIIAAKGLDRKIVAAQLFPKNAYPVLALNRVIAGETSLNEQQISKFAAVAGVELEDLYSPRSWRKTREGEDLVFQSQDWTARYNTETKITTLLHNNSMVHEEVVHKAAITLDDYLRSLELIIKKYSNEN